MKKGFASLAALYKENHSLSKQIENAAPGKKQQILDKLASNDKKILEYKEANAIASLNAQSTILEITEYDAGDAIQNSARLYAALATSSQKMLRYFETMLGSL